MAQENAKFAAVLIKYLQAEKLNDSKLVKEFIESWEDDSVEYDGIPAQTTKEMIEFAKTFIKKKMKCQDSQFTERMVEISTSEAFIEQVTAQVVTTTQRQEVRSYRGEY